MRTLLIEVAMIGWLAASAAVHAAGPVIGKLDPAEGQVGQSIRITGQRLKKTKSVHFLVGHTTRSAKFRADSDEELEVTVPEFYRAQAEALIVVQNPDGVAMTCPVTELIVRENQPRLNLLDSKLQSTVLHVIRGGVVKESPLVTVIDDGGIVNAIDRSPLVLVKNGGLLGLGHRHSSGHATMAFLEPESIVDVGGADSPKGWILVKAKEISLAEGVGPFVYQPLDVDPALAAANGVPEVAALSPVSVASGDIVTVKGKNFSGVNDVFAVSGVPHRVGFRIVSDTELKIELPDGYGAGHGELIIKNADGMTVTQSPAQPAGRPQPNGGRPLFPFIHVTAGKVVSEKDVSALNRPMFLVEKGGTVNSPNDMGVYLVKEGGTVTSNMGRIFYEPGASIPVTAIRPGDNVPVPKIQVSRLHSGLQFSRPALPFGK